MSMFWRLRVVAAAMGAVLLCGSAFADIRSFNAAVLARDYKKAAAEAATTWPTLDKSRADIAVIAREFGFAAYVAGDFAAAKTFGDAAVAGSAAHNESVEGRTGSEILLRLSELKLTPQKVSRDRLYGVLQTRVTQPSIDLLSYLSADTMTAYDFDKGNWKDASASAALGETLTAKSNGAYALQNFRFGLFKGVADYMASKDAKVFAQITSIKDRMLVAINAAPDDESARPIADFYWEVLAWQNAIGSHLVGRRKLKWPDKDDDERAGLRSTDRAVRLLSLRSGDDPCVSEIDMRRNPQYPSSALYKGIIGTVILRVDIDAKGDASNPKILAAVPGEMFGAAVLRSVDNIRYKPTKDWGPACSLAYPGRVVTFQFVIG